MLFASSFRMCLVGFSAVLAAGASAQTLSLTVDSETGDWIGQGQHLTFNYSTATPGSLYMNNYFYQADLKPGYAEFIMGDSSQDPNTFAIFTIGTNKLGQSIQAGTYNNAERAATASVGHAGLDFSFQNRGSNTLTGKFTVNSIHYVNVAGTFIIQDLDVNFEQHSEGATPACFGRVVYNSGIVPEPASMLSITFSSTILLRRRLKKSSTAKKHVN